MNGNGQKKSSRGATLLPLLLTLAALSLGAAGWSPAEFVRGANRQAHQAYASVSRFTSDLRLVYEIHSRLEELKAEAAAPAPAPSPGKAPGGEGSVARCSASAAVPSP